VRGAVAAAVFVGHFDDERNIVGQGGNAVLGIQNLHRLIGNDVGGADDAALMTVDADGLGVLAGILDDQALDIEDNVGDIFNDAGNGGDFMLNALDLHARDGAPFEAGQEHAP